MITRHSAAAQKPDESGALPIFRNKGGNQDGNLAEEALSWERCTPRSLTLITTLLIKMVFDRQIWIAPKSGQNWMLS
jgi:hypothetical protein